MEKKLKTLIENTDFEKVMKKLGYAFFTNGDYNVNIIGVRNLLDGVVQSDKYNDAIVMLYKVNGKWKKEIWDATTDPSLKLLKAPSNAKGTAILVPGQYRSVYAIDLHNGKYMALCQRLGNVKVYRDSNRDNKLDFNKAKIDTGMFGINIHRASAYNVAETIGSYSAGCQVFKSYKDFDKFMDICEKSRAKFGNKFTYTLLTTDQLK